MIVYHNKAHLWGLYITTYYDHRFLDPANNGPGASCAMVVLGGFCGALCILHSHPHLLPYCVNCDSSLHYPGGGCRLAWLEDWHAEGNSHTQDISGLYMMQM